MTETVLPAESFKDQVVFITGSSRGIGADTARLFAEAGANLVINYREKAPRAEKLAKELKEKHGVEVLTVGADLTKAEDLDQLFAAIKEKFGKIDLLVLNASGGMERDVAEDYALKLNRDAQLATLEGATNIMSAGSRVLFVTSHQAHFIRTVPTLPQYEPVALSKRAGEDALREQIPGLAEKGIDFVVISGDMIEGTITAMLLDRAEPGAIEARREAAGKLYSVAEFAAEIAKAAIEPVPADNTKLVGDISSFTV